MDNKVQKQILKLYVIDHLTVKKIASRRKTSVQAVYKVLKELRKRGLLQRQSLKATTPPPPLVERYYRLHGLQWDITIIDQRKTYQNALKRGNIINLYNNTIVMYKDKIEIYLGKDISFNSETQEETFIQAFNYFNDLIDKLESRYNMLLRKHGYHNITLCSGHLAEVNNEMARELYLTKEYITIYGTSDDKAWFKIDYSKRQYKEAETIHPQRFKKDAQIIFGKYLNDWRDKNPMTNSQLQEIMILNNPLPYLRANIHIIDDVFRYNDIIKCLNDNQRIELEEYLFRI